MKFSAPLTLLALGGFECAQALSQTLPTGWPMVFEVPKSKGIGKLGGMEINANGGSFWLNKTTKSFCSNSNKPYCPSVVRTVFAPLVGKGELHLGSYLPNENPADGQQAYCDGRTGYMKFAAGSTLPTGAITQFDTSSGSLKAINGTTQLNSFFCPGPSFDQYEIVFAEGSGLQDCGFSSLVPVLAYGAYAYV